MLLMLLSATHGMEAPVLSLTVRPRDMVCDVEEDWSCRRKRRLCRQEMSRTRGLEGFHIFGPVG